VKNTDTNAKLGICYPLGTDTDLKKYASCYLTQHLRQDCTKSNAIWQSNGVKATEERK
jgi:hypothetical protein